VAGGDDNTLYVDHTARAKIHDLEVSMYICKPFKNILTFEKNNCAYGVA
jgi:hypothetical protein